MAKAVSAKIGRFQKQEMKKDFRVCSLEELTLPDFDTQSFGAENSTASEKEIAHIKMLLPNVEDLIPASTSLTSPPKIYLKIANASCDRCADPLDPSVSQKSVLNMECECKDNKTLPLRRISTEATKYRWRARQIANQWLPSSGRNSLLGWLGNMVKAASLGGSSNTAVEKEPVRRNVDARRVARVSF